MSVEGKRSFANRLSSRDAGQKAAMTTAGIAAPEQEKLLAAIQDKKVKDELKANTDAALAVSES